jgi:hypothetical protein
MIVYIGSGLNSGTSGMEKLVPVYCIFKDLIYMYIRITWSVVCDRENILC